MVLKIITRTLLVLMAWLATGCALVGPQMTDAGVHAGRVELTEVPHYPYEDYFGATSALATVIAAQKVPVVPGDLVKAVNIPDRAGLIQPEIEMVIRTYGLVPYRLQSKHADLDLFAEVQAHNPVMVLLNIGPKSQPQWRYAVVVGVDPDSNSVFIRSGREARRVLSYGELLDAWRDGKFWAVVAARPEQIPATAQLREWVVAAAPLEQAGKAGAEVRADLSATQRWPKELLAWQALGNARYADRDLPGATTALLNALFLAPGDSSARNNLAQVLLERNCADQAEIQINQALNTETDPGRRTIFTRTRAAILNHSGPSVVCPGV